jgi:nucleoside-diphosphate-sugar epimerase
MSAASKTLITGSSGFLGSAVLRQADSFNLITPRSKDYDLVDNKSCNILFENNPDIDTVIHLAATCGGIQANQKNPGKYFYDNMSMGLNIIECCRKFNVNKLVLVGTVCSYPKYCAVPFKEQDLWNGFPEETNAPYGIAKKSLYIMADAYSRQYGLNVSILIPSNLYGPNDHFEEDKSHVIPAIIKKVYNAKKYNQDLIVWGDGSATRDFLYVDDAASAIVKSIAINTGTQPINLGSNQEVSIKTLVEQVCSLMEYDGKIIWDTTKPNGQPRRLIDCSLAKHTLGWSSTTNFTTGLKNTIKYYHENYAS